MFHYLRRNSMTGDESDKNLIYTVQSSRLEQKDIERAFARLFSTEDGKKVLGYLQMLSFHKAMAPSAPDEQLRHMEGQRALVATILRLIDRGRQP